MDRLSRWFRGSAIIAVAASPIVSHLALVSGRGTSLALVIAALQAVAAGFLLYGRWRTFGLLVPGVLLPGIALGAAHSAASGLAVAAGLAHALLYAGLLTVFGASLRPGQVAVVTRLAQRINPHFRPFMVPYTRAVTLAWCLFAALQLVLSITLLALAPLAWWLLLVSMLHGIMALALALLEFLVRSWRFRGQHASFIETMRGVRLSAWRGDAWRGDGSLNANTSMPTENYPSHSENVTPRPPPSGDSAPGPAA